MALSDERPTFLSAFAGIGGFDLALERAGFRCVGQVELDRGCRAILARRFPDARRWRDVRRVKATQIRRALDGSHESDGSERQRDCAERSDRGFAPRRLDLLVGGFPCQDLSVAGKRTGLIGRRSSLFHELVRIAKIARPRWGLFENVPGLLSSHSGRDMWTVLQGLRECWPAVGYRILDSRYFGVAQRRRRVFFVGGPTEQGVAQVLAESIETSAAVSNERCRAMLQRLNAMTVKLAMLAAAGRPDVDAHADLEITPADAEAAVFVAGRWRDYAVVFGERVGETALEQLIGRALKVFEAKRKKRISRRDIARAVHCAKRVMDEIEQTLEDRGDIVVEQPDDKKTRIWVLASS